MKNLLIFSLSLFLSISLFAQVPEDIITESGSPEDDIFLDGVVEETLMYENRVLAYEHVREADVPFQRKMWRVIDIREKMNLAFAYPPEPFITILLNGVETGELVAFDDDVFKKQLTKEQIDKRLFSFDTVPFLDPITYETTVKVVANEVNPEDITRFRVKEIWFYDEEASRLKNRILGIAPIKATFDDNGNFKYEGPLFWIYFKQAREFLGKHRAFVAGNDVAPMTWERLLTARKFSSYIIKSSNVLDNRLQDYTQIKDDPLEQLYEGNKIKEALFNWEHDLWSY